MSWGGPAAAAGWGRGGNVMISGTWDKRFKECVSIVAVSLEHSSADMLALKLGGGVGGPGATTSKSRSMPRPPAAAEAESAARVAPAKPAVRAKSTVTKPMAKRKQSSALGASAIDWLLPSGARAMLAHGAECSGAQFEQNTPGKT